MPLVYLGNHAALDGGRIADGGRVIEGQQVTTIHLSEDDTHSERVRTIIHDDGLWVRLSAEPPAWVESDDPKLESALAAIFDCPIGRSATNDTTVEEDRT